MFSYGHSVPGRKPGAKGASGIDNGMASDERIPADQGRWIIIRGLVIIVGQWLAQHRIVTDYRVVTDLNIVINSGVISNPHIRADPCAFADVNISTVKFHIMELPALDETAKRSLLYGSMRIHSWIIQECVGESVVVVPFGVRVVQQGRCRRQAAESMSHVWTRFKTQVAFL